MPTEKDYQDTSRDSYEMNGSEGDVEVLKFDVPVSVSGRRNRILKLPFPVC